MTAPDYARSVAALSEGYAPARPRSAELDQRARRVMIDGGSHAVRLTQPFPPRIRRAGGAWLTDEDGHQVLDYWQGHMANLLGHNPALITSALAEALAGGRGLQTGFTDRCQVEVAERLCRLAGCERVRFTTSGSLATMYAIVLARAYTGREIVLKAGGAWHGSQPWGLKGVHYEDGYEHVESEGQPRALTDDVVITRFNDPDFLRDQFRRLGDRAACFIVEPVLGTGGMLPATREYLQAARELTERTGALLIFDEVISGFRFHAGGAGALYGIEPDLSTYGKIIGGGMPVAAVAGRADVLELAGEAGGRRVAFSGGTYSGHPASMLAAHTMLAHLEAHGAEVYPRLAEAGAQTRRVLEAALADEGFDAVCTGDADVLPGSSLFMVHFPRRGGAKPARPDDAHDPAQYDVELSETVLPLALLIENAYILRGHGAATTEHTAAEAELLGEACRRAARRIKQYI